MNPKKLVIASRESLLAMWQAKHIQGRLKIFQDFQTMLYSASRRSDTGIRQKPAISKAVRFDNLIFSNQNRMRALRYTRYLNSTR